MPHLLGSMALVIPSPSPSPLPCTSQFWLNHNTITLPLVPRYFITAECDQNGANFKPFYTLIKGPSLSTLPECLFVYLFSVYTAWHKKLIQLLKKLLTILLISFPFNKSTFTGKNRPVSTLLTTLPAAEWRLCRCWSGRELWRTAPLHPPQRATAHPSHLVLCTNNNISYLHTFLWNKVSISIYLRKNIYIDLDHRYP